MNTIIIVLILIFTITFSLTQQENVLDRTFRENVSLEFKNNYSKCEPFTIENGILEYL